MTDKDKKDNLRIVNFKESKEKEEKMPDFIIEKIELLLEKAKAGLVETAVIHFDYYEKEEKEEYFPTCTFLWNRTGNVLELLGITEIIKTFALDKIFSENIED